MASTPTTSLMITCSFMLITVETCCHCILTWCGIIEYCSYGSHQLHDVVNEAERWN